MLKPCQKLGNVTQLPGGAWTRTPAESRAPAWRLAEGETCPMCYKGPCSLFLLLPFSLQTPTLPNSLGAMQGEGRISFATGKGGGGGGGGGRGGELQAQVYEDAFLTDKALQGRLRASEGPPDPSSKQQGQQRLAKFASCSCGRKRGSAVCASLPYLGIILSRVLRHFPPQEQAAGGVFHSHKSQPRGLGFGVGFLFQVSPKLAHATEREGGAID